ncbi:serine/threonine-protein kinase/receptor R818 [Scenedesmus sp. PABB004]|nr:serine/threonine-protein kinase/receptor R818 [Scenedesmus sp. PABB004]
MTRRADGPRARRRRGAAALAAVAAAWACCLAGAAATASAFSCLDYVQPLGTTIDEPPVPPGAPRATAGATARWCNAACAAAAPRCTAAWSVGAATLAGPACRLLSHDTSDVERAGRNLPGRSYPSTQLGAAFAARDGLQNRTLGYLCLRSQADWDELGRTLAGLLEHEHRGARGSAHEGYCAHAHDVAGLNLGRASNTSSAGECREVCAATPDCTHITFALTRGPDGEPASSYDCWLKTSAMSGDNGWTAGYVSDSYAQADGVVTCFDQLADWRKYGLVLNPSIESLRYGDSDFTLFPERVTFDEAAAVCRELPNGSLAVLPQRQAVLGIGQRLLPALPFQRALQSAWVGAVGENYGRGANASADADARAAGVQLPPSDDAAARTLASLRWLDAARTPVAPALVKHLRQRAFSWMWHDSLLAFQTAVSPREARVCGVLVNQFPPPGLPPEPGDNEPGVLYADCENRPAAFICESSGVPDEVSQGQLGRVSALERVSGSPAADDSRDWVWKLVVGVAVPLGILVLVCATAAACQCSSSLERARLAWAYQRKRVQGKPSSGHLSVAVTDIQGFTRLMEQQPEAMAKALALHNHIIRQATYAFAGCVLEQEGDSYILAFHSPLDACAFALQVQQALLEAPWPGISYGDGWEGRAAAGADGGRGPGAAPPLAAKSAPLASGAPGQRWSEPGDVELAAGLGSASGHGMGRALSACARPGSVWLANGGAAAHDSIEEEEGGLAAPDGRPAAPRAGSWLAKQLGQLRAAAVAAEGVERKSSGSSGGGGAKQGAPRGLRSLCGWSGSTVSEACGVTALPLSTPPSAGALVPGAPSCGSSAGALSPKSAVRRQWWRHLLQAGGASGPPLFAGLRVRIGIGSGTVHRGEAIESTAAYAAARAVSDCANGGQVLIDAVTFAAVRDQLHRLGLVGPQGWRLRSLPSRRAGCLRRAHAKAGSTGAPQDAVALDMGLYQTAPLWPGRSASVRAASCEAGELALQVLPVDVADGGDLLSGPSALRRQLQLDCGASAARAASFSEAVRTHLRRLGPSIGSAGSWQRRQGSLLSAGEHSCVSVASGGTPGGTVRLYQLLPPSLTGRAALFGNTLGIPDGWRCLDQPYFAAPGLCELVAGGEAQSRLLQGASPSSPQPSDGGAPAAGSAASGSSQQLAALRAASLNCSWQWTARPGSQAEDSRGAGGLRRPGAPAFPPVTFCFVAVEGSQQLQLHRYPGLRDMHLLLHRLLLEAVQQVPGSYLCRAQQGELRFLAAFASPAGAVEWALLVQEAALWVPWPPSLLGLRWLCPQHDAAGRLVFRGPRLRMGLAQGSPASIAPDARGRADYCGAAVNSAARITDAAAHGGQVVSDTALAKAVLACWQARGGEGRAPTPEPAPEPAPEPLAAAQADGSGARGGAALAPRFTAQTSFARAAAAPPVAVPVQVSHVGCFAFKGASRPAALVSFAAACHAGRALPAEPPRGKGVCVAPRTGAFATPAVVALPSALGGAALFS